MKKIVAVSLSLLLLAGSIAVSGESRIFEDSTGRTVPLPAGIDRVAVTGPMAQYMVFAIAPEKLVGLSEGWNAAARSKLSGEALSLPVLGQLYGGKGEINLEELLLSDPQVVIDIGEPLPGIAEDMERLSLQTGLPFVHLDAGLMSLDSCFLSLGELLGKAEEAASLAEYCRRVCRIGAELAAREEKKSLLYITGENGLNVIARGSFQGELVDLLSENRAAVESPSSMGTGNEVDWEQLMLWDPEVILFAPESRRAVEETGNLSLLQAVQTGSFAMVPHDLQNWMGFPPGCQRLMGMLWLGRLLYPEQAQYDLYELIGEYYRLFYHCELSREAFDELLSDCRFHP